VSQSDLFRIRGRLQQLAPDALHLRCTHRVTGVQKLDGAPFDRDVTGLRAVLFAGVGRPEAFATTVRGLGVEVVGVRWWPDHYAYRERDIISLLKPDRFPPHDVLITTEKDAARLTRLGELSHLHILVVTIEIDFLEEDSTMLQSFLERSLRKV